jgi:hypothetical protein
MPEYIAEPVAAYEVLSTDQQPALLKKFVRFARRPAIATVSLLALLTAGALWWMWRNDMGQAVPKADAPMQTASAQVAERTSGQAFARGTAVR